MKFGWDELISRKQRIQPLPPFFNITPFPISFSISKDSLARHRCMILQSFGSGRGWYAAFFPFLWRQAAHCPETSWNVKRHSLLSSECWMGSITVSDLKLQKQFQAICCKGAMSVITFKDWHLTDCKLQNAEHKIMLLMWTGYSVVFTLAALV